MNEFQSFGLSKQIVFNILSFLTLKDLLKLDIPHAIIIRILGGPEEIRTLLRDTKLIDLLCAEIVESFRCEQVSETPWFICTSKAEFDFYIENFKPEFTAALNHVPKWQNVSFLQHSLQLIIRGHLILGLEVA